MARPSFTIAHDMPQLLRRSVDITCRTHRLAPAPEEPERAAVGRVVVTLDHLAQLGDIRVDDTQKRGGASRLVDLRDESGRIEGCPQVAEAPENRSGCGLVAHLVLLIASTAPCEVSVRPFAQASPIRVASTMRQQSDRYASDA